MTYLRISADTYLDGVRALNLAHQHFEFDVSKSGTIPFPRGTKVF